MRAAAAWCIVALAGCADATSSGANAGENESPHDVPGPAPRELTIDGTSSGIVLDVVLSAGQSASVGLTASEGVVLVVRAPSLSLTLDGVVGSELGFHGPTSLDEGGHELLLAGPAGTHAVTVKVLGRQPPSVDEARSLVWRSAALLDEPGAAGLGRVLSLLAADGHGGRLLAAWLQRFGTTAHSERAGPVLLAESLVAAHGADPAQWPLDELPFVVTAIHNRLDLRSDSHCGELRISMACVDPSYQPFHLIFRFRQLPLAEDLSPAGALHCAATALQWASLSSLNSSEFLLAASALLDGALSSDSFIDAESVEFIVSPWEWRQWDLVANTEPSTSALLPLVFDNPPLFQTVDIPALNQPGALRNEFLAFVEANAPALASRSLELPARFRARSARVNAGVPWVPLDLGGVDPEVLDANPKLRQQIEIIGCPACHATDAEFVQTRADRTFSPFYQKELLARAADLQGVLGGERTAVRFGPLQPEPLLPP